MKNEAKTLENILVTKGSAVGLYGYQGNDREKDRMDRGRDGYDNSGSNQCMYSIK